MHSIFTYARICTELPNEVESNEHEHEKKGS